MDILFRLETVREFSSRVSWQRILDVGCGDGSISLQLLTQNSHLTLLDISKSMLSIAKERVPEHLAANVVVRHENFQAACFGDERFDLIITVGVMAHVDSPDAFLAKLRSLLNPGGSLIIEFTDSRHFVGRVGRGLGRLKEAVAPARYETNKLSYSIVASLFQKHRLRQCAAFRYARVPVPAVDRLMGTTLQYRLAKRVFNDCVENTNAALGNEYICMLTAD